MPDDADPTQTPRTFTQDELNAILAEDRRKTAARYADYDDLKAAKAKLDQVEDAAKTELQKAVDRATAAETERDALKQAETDRQAADAHATQVKTWTDAAAKKNGIPADAIKGATEEEIFAHAKQLAALLPRTASAPREGELPKEDGNSELRGIVRQLFNSNN